MREEALICQRPQLMEAIDGRIAPESITEDTMSGLEIVDGHAVKAPGDYEDPDRLYDMLIARIPEIPPVYRCVHGGKSISDGKIRPRGPAPGNRVSPYIIHPLWVSIILADLEMDKETITAGLLHDVVEDTKYTEEDIRKEFGRRGGASCGRRYQAGKIVLFFR